jgi:hypothetical protein
VQRLGREPRPDEIAAEAAVPHESVSLSSCEGGTANIACSPRDGLV